MGKRVDPTEKRGRMVAFRLTDAQFVLVTNRAKAMGLSVSAYLCLMATDAVLPSQTNDVIQYNVAVVDTTCTVHAEKPAPKRRQPRAKADVAEQPHRPSLDACLTAMETAANADGTTRFVVPRGADFDRAAITRVQNLVTAYPDVTIWTRHGEWIAAGHVEWMLRSGPLGLGYVLSQRFRPDVALSKKWDGTAPGKKQTTAQKFLSFDQNDFPTSEDFD